MPLPTTRYYGSKRKLVETIWNALEENGIEFDSVLDLFGGTGIVSYYMLRQGKTVIYNDIMSFNCQIANALMNSVPGCLLHRDVQDLFVEHPDRNYRHYIEEYFNGIYYLQDENRTIDIVRQNIDCLPVEQQASALYLLFQSCLIKRPFNLFHRNNLNLRLNHKNSNFGNAVTWERPFTDLFDRFLAELHRSQMNGEEHIHVMNCSALQCEAHADLVYIDPPYFPSNYSNVSYHCRYHFLEGLMHYADIPQLINHQKRNNELTCGMNPEFENKTRFLHDLDDLLANHEDSVVALSYNTDGYPSVAELSDVVARHKNDVRVCDLGDYSYALNRHNDGRQEILIIGQ